MAEYTKHNSNYIKTVRHQFLKDGSTVYERDWVTVGSQLNFGPGKIPYYNDGNFIFTTSPIPFYQKKYKNGVTLGMWTYENVGNASNDINQIHFDEYTEDIRSYVYYGSCLELLRVTLENIIKTFPGNITLSDERLEIPPTTENGNYTYINGYILNNPFQIDLYTKDVVLQQYDNELRFLSYSWQKYNINGHPITSYKISDWMGDLDCPQNDQYYIKKAPVVNVTINGNIVLKGYKSGNDIIFCYEGENLTIQPKDDVIEEYFNGLEGFERQLLTRKTKPQYSSKFVTPIEYNLGYVYYKRTYTWPSNGYCIDITSPQYYEFVNKLVNLAQLFDELWTDNLWRRMTHEAIKNYDWTYTRQYTEGDEQDNVDGGDRMHKVINIIGRVFDDIKRTIDTIKKNNRVTYNGDRNIPNALLSDKLELRGWDVYSTIPTYLEEVEIPNDIVITESFVNQYITKKSGAERVPKWYPTIEMSKITFGDVDIEFMRRLLLSTRRIFETKGTRESIDMIMAMFGYGNMDETIYEVTEEYYITHPVDYDSTPFNGSNESFGDRIVRLNTRAKELDLVYDEDASGIPVGSFVSNDKTYLIPFYNQNKLYDGNLYFQMRGGWLYDEAFYYDEAPNPYKWTETLSYLHVASSVKDLLNVNPNDVKKGDIYYVANINDYIEFTEETLYSNFFALIDEYNPEKFFSWLNLNLEDDFYETEPLYDSYAKKARYLDNIIPYSKGNNPHVGYGDYDMGKEYLDYMKQPFKYSIDEHNFTTQDEGDAKSITFYLGDGVTEENDDKPKESDRPRPIVDNEKVQIVDDNVSKYFINTKVIHFKNKITNKQYKQYFKKVILKYLIEMIPSTAIFIVEFPTVRCRFYDKDKERLLRTIKVEPGDRITLVGDWYLWDDPNKTQVPSPYTVNEDTDFVELVRYRIRWYEDIKDTNPTVQIPLVIHGDTINAFETGQRYYRKEDTNRTIVGFPIRAERDEDFVKVVECIVSWYESDGTLIETQRVYKYDYVSKTGEWYKDGDSSQTIVSFPYEVEENIGFVKYIQKHTVKYFEDESEEQLLHSQQVEHGHTTTNPFPSDSWYVSGDSTKTIINFSTFVINNDVDLIKYVQTHTVQWVDDGEVYEDEPEPQPDTFVVKWVDADEIYYNQQPQPVDEYIFVLENGQTSYSLGPESASLPATILSEHVSTETTEVIFDIAYTNGQEEINWVRVSSMNSDASTHKTTFFLSVSENRTSSQRSGKIVFTQRESGKTITINFVQRGS